MSMSNKIYSRIYSSTKNFTSKKEKKRTQRQVTRGEGWV